MVALFCFFSDPRALAPADGDEWDRFAREKGITGKKRSRMVWDNDMKEWRPRHGYKRANDGVLNHPIVEAKEVIKNWEACFFCGEGGMTFPLFVDVGRGIDVGDCQWSR